jgi:predicted MFS family arabinose efflux permease
MSISIRNPYHGLRGLSGDVWIICMTTFVNRAGMMALPFLVLYLTKQIGVSPSVAGFAVSAYGLGGIVATPIAGRLADRFGPFVIMRGSLALTGLVLIVLSFVHSLAPILVLTCLWGSIAESERPATTFWLSAATSADQRRAAMALLRLAINLGMSIGPAVGGFIAVISFPLVFIADGLTSLAAATVLTVLFFIRQHAISNALSIVSKGSAPTAYKSSRTTSVVWSDRAARLFFTVFLLVSIVFTQHQGAMALYLVRDLHYRETFYGGLFVLNTLMVVALEVPLNIAMSQWQMRRVIALSATLIAVGFGSLAVVTMKLPIVVTVIIWTFGEMIFFPTAMGYVAELAPTGRTGEYMGAFWSTFSLAIVVGPWAGAALLERFGARATWSAMLLCGLAAAAITRALSNQRQSIIAAMPR